jgi:excisionase family DNA binding protein
VNELLTIGRSLSIAQAQELLRVSRRTVYYWIASGKLATVRTISGGSQRILLESTWVNKRLKEIEQRAKLDAVLADINRKPQIP